MTLERVAATSADSGDDHELRAMSRRFWFAAAVTIPLFVFAMGDMLPGQPISHLNYS